MDRFKNFKCSSTFGSSKSRVFDLSPFNGLRRLLVSLWAILVSLDLMEAEGFGESVDTGLVYGGSFGVFFLVLISFSSGCLDSSFCFLFDLILALGCCLTVVSLIGLSKFLSRFFANLCLYGKSTSISSARPEIKQASHLIMWFKVLIYFHSKNIPYTISACRLRKCTNHKSLSNAYSTFLSRLNHDSTAYVVSLSSSNLRSLNIQ